MDTPTLDTRFSQLLDDMQFNFYRRCRAYRPDHPLSYFVDLGFWTAEDVRRYENRYQREAKT